MRIVIARVGRQGPTDPLVQQAHDYLRRIRFAPITVHAAAAPSEILRPRGACHGCRLIALDERGHQPASVDLADKLRAWSRGDQSVAFVIGPACGLGPEVLRQAHAVWSLSRLTLPHRMAFCLLAEQLYRAGEILQGGAYHK